MRKEKHVPIIKAPEEVRVVVGKTVPHPNTVEHHIKWIIVFVEEDVAFPPSS